MMSDDLGFGHPLNVETENKSGENKKVNEDLEKKERKEEVETKERKNKNNKGSDKNENNQKFKKGKHNSPLDVIVDEKKATEKKKDEQEEEKKKENQEDCLDTPIMDTNDGKKDYQHEDWEKSGWTDSRGKFEKSI